MNPTLEQLWFAMRILYPNFDHVTLTVVEGNVVTTTTLEGTKCPIGVNDVTRDATNT